MKNFVDKYQFARKLRQELTEEERKLWRILRNRNFEGLRFKRQSPIGKYIVDFYCPEKMLIIELDGGHHLENKKDKVREKYLIENGYTILRFWNNEINDNLNGVLLKIKEVVDNLK